eukprot:238911_1
MILTAVLLISVCVTKPVQYREVSNDPSLVYYDEYIDSNVAGPDQDLECQVRLLAYEYALNTQEFRGTQPDTFNALQIDHYCDQETYTKLAKTIDKKYYYRSNTPIIDDSATFTVYVDPIHGNDNNNGNISSPLKTLPKALITTRSQKSNALTKQIVLREGISYITETINLSPNTFDNNLLIRGYPNENAWLSGGIFLNTKELLWKRYNDGN